MSPGHASRSLDGSLWLLLVTVALTLASAAAQSSSSTPRAPTHNKDHPFAVPDDLLIGAGGSSLQTEGAWNEDGKGESLADYLFNKGGMPMQVPGQTHHVAADTYHRYKEDVAMAAKLKLKLYRLSFSWSRLLPNGDASKPNAKGLRFYHDFIDEIRRHNMTPFVTLYHFDHPKIFEDLFKGFQGAQIETYFREYARFVFREFANKVPMWTTINEPNVVCATVPYLMRDMGEYEVRYADQYRCLRNSIMAHAAAYRVFKQDGHRGQLGLSTFMMHGRPKTTDVRDVYAAEALNDIGSGLPIHVAVHGDYPQIAKDVLGARLVPLSAAEQSFIKGTVDFVGLNTYYGAVVEYAPNPYFGEPTGMPGFVVGPVRHVPFVSFTYPKGLYLEANPEALRDSVLWTWQRYGLPIVVAEHGLADEGLGKRDMRRAAHFSMALRTLVSTVRENHAKVIAFCAWSLIDDFEYFGGHTRPFGLVHIDYEGGSLNRTLKDSSKFWIELGNTGVVPLVRMPSSSGLGASSSGMLVGIALIGVLLFTPRTSD